jgi:hypothetical protein
MSQAAKIGQPVVAAVKGSKLSAGFVHLADLIAGTAAEAVEKLPVEDKAKKSVMAGFKALIAKKKPAGA